LSGRNFHVGSRGEGFVLIKDPQKGDVPGAGARHLSLHPHKAK
jgi:hypothetical protein